MNSGEPGNSKLPAEFMDHGPKFNFSRVVAIAAIMTLVAFFMVPRITKTNGKTKETTGLKANSVASQQTNPNGNDVFSGSETQGINAYLQKSDFVAGKGNKGALPKLISDQQVKRGFIAADVANLRQQPDGKVIGQLVRGEQIYIRQWDEKSKFIEITTDDEQSGFVSSELISSERPFGVFEGQKKYFLSYDDLSISVPSDTSSQELSRNYSEFLRLLNSVPLRSSFDFERSNIKYFILASSEIVFPANSSTVLSWIRRSSYKPGVFFEGIKEGRQSGDSLGFAIKTRLPVRLVPANQPGQSTILETVEISNRCEPRRMRVMTTNKRLANLELLLIDIKKKMAPTVTTRPHNGSPNFVWAYADLDGDSWPDLAFYFGGESAASHLKYLFVARNYLGTWQLQKLEVQASLGTDCV